MPHLDRDGVRIWYEVHGDGPVVLLSHGFSATSQMWAPQIDPVAARYRVVTWDMRGHGRSGAPEDAAAYTEEATVADMAAVLDEVGAERVALVGMSMGGYMSLAFNLRHPDRVAALVLEDTGPGFKKDEARAQWNATADRRATTLEEQGLGALQERSEVSRGAHTSAQGLAHAARGMMGQRDARVIESLPSVVVPTLVVVGADDAPFLAAADYMAAKIPNAEKVVIPDAGHASNLDQPAVFNRALLDFLGGVEW